MLPKHRAANKTAAPKAGVSILGRRFEGAFLYRVKQRLDYPRAVVTHRIRGTVGGTLITVLTLLFDLRTLKRLRNWGLLKPVEVLLRGGYVFVPYGVTRGSLFWTRHIDITGAQTYHVIRGTLEPMVQEALRRTLGEGGTFYDIGANIGYFSLTGVNLVGPGGQVVAVEPDPANVRAVEENVRLNRVENVSVFEAAACDQSEPVELVRVEDSGWSHLAQTGDHRMQVGRSTVEGISLDDLASRDGVRPPDVVKIDVEGAELLVLQGMPELLRERGPTLIIEMHGRNREVINFLRDFDYKVVNLDGPEDPATAPDSIHVLAQQSKPARPAP